MGSRLAAVSAAAGLVLGLGTTPGEAQETVTADLDVSLTIETECIISAVNALDFGTSGFIDVAIAGTTTIDVQCTDTTPFTIALDEGDGTLATVATRYLSDTITYSLYRDTSHLLVWGDTVGTNTVAGTGDGSDQTFTIYGLVPIQTTPVPGTYTDQVTITVAY